MSAQLVEMLKGRIDREATSTYIGRQKDAFNFLVTLMQKEEQPASWRAAWIVNHLSEKNDKRLQKPLHNIIKSIKGKEDGHQRELIKIVRKMQLNEKMRASFLIFA